MEEFRKIEGFENYSVSNHGNVRNDNTGLILKPRRHTAGYHTVCLGRNHYKYIHRLVANAFCENENNYVQVDHIDHNKTNNNYQNLRWVSQPQNMKNVMKREGTTSRYLGVSYNAKDKRWRARISVNEKSIHIGQFKTEDEARDARREAIIKYNLEEFYPPDAV